MAGGSAGAIAATKENPKQTEQEMLSDAAQRLGVSAKELRSAFACSPGAHPVRNALAHTPAGTPVEVSVRDGDGTVTLAVRDHGPGLPTTDTDRLFERFWRAEGGRERGRAGAGLGLAIVAGIVAAHGGAVTAADAPGGGAEFTVGLPANGSGASGSPVRVT